MARTSPVGPTQPFYFKMTLNLDTCQCSVEGDSEPNINWTAATHRIPTAHFAHHLNV